MDPLGTLMSVAHVLKRAYDLYQGCVSAAEEIQIAAGHVQAMALVLEGVKSDIANNKNSFVHQTTAIAKTKTHTLKVNISLCEGALKRTEVLLNTYRGYKKKAGGLRLWDKFRWSTEGKKAIADCKVELMMATSMLDLFLSKEGLNILWKLESMMELMMRKFAALELLQPPPAYSPPRRGRPRAGSNVTRTLVISLVLSRLRKVLTRYRRRKLAASKRNGNPNPGPRRPKPVSRQNTGFAPNKNRNQLIQNYANQIANAAAYQQGGKKTQRGRTPSPDFYMLGGQDGRKNPAPPRPIRRSSSMQRLMGRIQRNAKVVTPKEHYECWRVGLGSLAIGFKTAPQFVPHRRGQLQIKKMAAILKEADGFSRNVLSEGDSRVKLILKSKNDKEKMNNSRRRWSLVAGRVIKRDPGKTGMVSVEKAFVILVRR
jgi:hypothetical protein